jgi:hypothetical protein
MLPRLVKGKKYLLTDVDNVIYNITALSSNLYEINSQVSPKKSTTLNGTTWDVRQGEKFKLIQKLKLSDFKVII